MKGLRELDRAFREVDREASRELRAELKDAAEVVAADARRRLEPISPSSAASIKSRARAAGAFVEQSKRRTTGQHPEFGRLQMERAFLPAVDANEPEVVRRVEAALERVEQKAGF